MNTVMTHFTYGLNDAILSPKKPNPPVPAVARERRALSNTPIPPNKSITNIIAVMQKYMIYNIRAVSFSLGTNLPTEGPGDSAFMMLILLPPDIGMMASRKTRTPIPPIQ